MSAAAAARRGEGLLSLALEYLHPWTNDTGFYLASDEGLYRGRGLSVDIAAHDPLRGDALAHLLRGEADLAVCPSNRLLWRCDRGEPLVGIAAVNHRALETIQTIADTGIERPRDLEGKRLAYNPTPRGTAMVRHLVAGDGGDPDRVITVDSGVRELTVDDIAAGEADATFGAYWAWDVLFGTLPAERRVVWPVEEIGAPRYHSYLIATRRDVFEERREELREFLAATGEGFVAAELNHPRALSTLERVIPFFPRPLIARSLELISTTWLEGDRWGEQRQELLEGYARWLHASEILTDPDVWRRASTNELLPAWR